MTVHTDDCPLIDLDDYVTTNAQRYEIAKNKWRAGLVPWSYVVNVAEENASETTEVKLRRALTATQAEVIQAYRDLRLAEGHSEHLEGQIEQLNRKIRELERERDGAVKERQQAEQMLTIAGQQADDDAVTITELRGGANAVIAALKDAGMTDGNTIYRVRELARERDSFKEQVAKNGTHCFSDAMNHLEANATPETTLAYFTRWYARTEPTERAALLPAVVADMERPWHKRSSVWQSVVLSVLETEADRPGVTPQDA